MTFADAVLERCKPVGYTARAGEVCCLAKFDARDFRRGVEFARHRALDAATAFMKTTLLAPHCSPYQLALLGASFSLRYLRRFQRIAATDEPTFFIVMKGSLELVRELDIVEKT